MRVCSPQLGLSPNATLGGEVYDRELLTRFARLGNEVEILLPAGLAYPSVAGWNVTRLPLRRGYRWFVSNPLLVPYIGRAYRRRPFDVLRVHSLRFTGMAALWARRLYRLPVPIVAHHHHLDRDRWTDRIEGRVTRRADRIVTVSSFSQQQLCDELGVPEEKIAVVHNGVADVYHPVSPNQALRQRLGLNGARVLLHVGSLTPRKNLPILLEALQRVLTRVPQTRLLLVGRGPEEARLRQLAQSLELEAAVVFAGFVPEPEKLDYYSVAHVYISPSSMEGFGLAVGEAMACGLPVVASRAGALPEVVSHGETGLLVPPGDADALAEATSHLLQHEALAQRLGQGGRARVDRLFRWSTAARQTLALYQEAVGAWRP